MARSNPRARAQRETAARVKQYRANRDYQRVLPKSITAKAISVREDYLQQVFEGNLPRPDKNSAEGRSLASAAGKARWGKAPKEYEQAFKDYWYHNKSDTTSEVDEE